MALGNIEYTYTGQDTAEGRRIRTERITEFRGLNLRGVKDDNEMSEMLNLCSDEYPMLATARPYGLSDSISKDAHVVQLMPVSYVNDRGRYSTALYALAENDSGSLDVLKNGNKVASVGAGNRMVGINKKICFFPDKKWIGAGYDNPVLASLQGSLTHHSVVTLYKDHLTFSGGVPEGHTLKVGDAIDISATVGTGIPRLAYRYGSIPTTSDRFYLSQVGTGPSDGTWIDGSPATFRQRVTISARVAYGVRGDARTFTQTSPTTMKLTGISGTNLKISSVTIGSGSNVGSTDHITITKDRVSYRISVDDAYVDGNGRITIKFVSDTTVPISTTSGVSTLDNDFTVQVKYTGTTRTHWTLGVLANEINNSAGVISKITENSIYFEKDMWFLPDEYGLTYMSGDLNIRMKRDVPDMEYIIEWNNRLWGCNSSANTIYASKLGDPTNWNYFQSTALDSYAAEQGSNGIFTGVGKYSTHLLFFKEDCIHKVYGGFPSEFQIITQECSGCEEGSSDSIVTLEDGVLYKSRRGVMAYSGGTPTLISSNFGRQKFANAVAGYDGEKYWISMDYVGEDGETTGGAVTMTYDVALGIWHIYDFLKYTAFCKRLKWFYFARAWDYGYFGRMAGRLNMPRTEDNYSTWRAVFGPFDEWYEGEKIYSVISIRYELDPGREDSPPYIRVSIRPDNGDYEEVAMVSDANNEGHEIRFTPKRCDHFSLMISGEGHCKIKSITREYRMGSAQKENY